MRWLPRFLKSDINEIIQEQLNDLIVFFSGDNIYQEISTQLTIISSSEFIIPSELTQTLKNLLLNIYRCVSTNNSPEHQVVITKFLNLSESLGAWSYDYENRLTEKQPFPTDTDIHIRFASRDKTFKDPDLLRQTQQKEEYFILEPDAPSTQLRQAFLKGYKKAKHQWRAGFLGSLAGTGLVTWLEWSAIATGDPTGLAMIGLSLLAGLVVARIFEMPMSLAYRTPSPPVVADDVGGGSYARDMAQVAPQVRAQLGGNKLDFDPSIDRIRNLHASRVAPAPSQPSSRENKAAALRH